jgi:phosphate/sulfate permease
VSFRTLKYLSFTHSAIYTALLISWAAGADDVKYVLGWAHGIGWIVMSLLAIAAVRSRTIPLWLGVMVAVIGGVGPFAGSIGFVYEERRGSSTSRPVQRGMV